MDPLCHEFREHRLAALGGGPGSGADRDAHAEACADCRGWAARAESVAAAVGGLARLEAPEELLERVARAIEPRGAETEARWDACLGQLERRRAPRVLDRLVEEELASAAQASVRRFAGDLERLPAPATLELRLFGGERALRGGRALRWLGAAAALLATAFAIARLDRERPGRPFEVVYELPADPHPLAATLVDGWATARIRPGGEPAGGGSR